MFRMDVGDFEPVGYKIFLKKHIVKKLGNFIKINLDICTALISHGKPHKYIPSKSGK